MKDQKMLVRRTQSVSPVRTMREMMDHMMEDFFSDHPLMRIRPFEWRIEGFMPFVDVVDEDKQITLEMEVPGIGQEDLEVTVTSDSLILRGEKRQEKEEGYCYRERCFGPFERVFLLPSDIDRDNIKAYFRNGVLTVIIPKSEQSMEQTRKIEIGSEQVSRDIATQQQNSSQAGSKQDEDVLEGAGLA